MRLLRATLEDFDRLLKWRNDPRTREASTQTGLVCASEHSAWLTEVLQDLTRQLYVAWEDDHAVGTARADLKDGVYELSWSVAPAARGRGVAARMVTLLAARLSGPIRAEIKVSNEASVRVAEHIGMSLEGHVGDTLHYSRK